MRTVHLDGAMIATAEQLHSQIADKLGLGDDYGCNLDALWDSLTGRVELPLTLKWEHYSISEQRLGQYAGKVVQLFQQAEEELPDFTFVITNV